ncbi:GNAT family N-acetyltransferase [Paenibacillus anaericanus]|uniref:GNAT family N-acetyltransferase n=1 Tax=Paenibacillus anaericanus TaxID=170367 RepID=A0A433YDT9_9BACL|nr:GNAT family N-acetyltransferase [Paenibacillus anaericanus]RUT48007.1 GNAT family N-acetyltransferase [Paenibacillus anaericanus]
MSGLADHYYIREITEEELPLALDFRQRMFSEMGVSDEVLISDSKQILQEMYSREFGAGRLRHYVAYPTDSLVPVAICGALIKDDFPYFLFRPGSYGWIVDVYTVPEHRGKGLAKVLLTHTHDWLISKGILEAKLIASGKEARRLYERSGYAATWEMTLSLTGGATFNSIIDER